MPPRDPSTARLSLALLVGTVLGTSCGNSDGPVSCPGLTHAGAVVRVLDAPTQTPLSAATVEITDANGTTALAEIEPGVYKADVSQGDYAVRVVAAGYLEGTDTVEVRQVASLACGHTVFGEVTVPLLPQGGSVPVWLIDFDEGIARPIGHAIGR